MREMSQNETFQIYECEIRFYMVTTHQLGILTVNHSSTQGIPNQHIYLRVNVKYRLMYRYVSPNNIFKVDFCKVFPFEKEQTYYYGVVMPRIRLSNLIECICQNRYSALVFITSRTSHVRKQ